MKYVTFFLTDFGVWAIRGVMAKEMTKEPQYNDCLRIRDEIGVDRLGLMTNQVWFDDPRRLAFVLARYKFVAKMLSGRRRVAELGCGDAFGSRIVLQEIEKLSVFDFDPVFIADVSGVPCVVTDVGDAAHLVGEYGRVVAPGDAGAMASALQQMIDMDDAERKALGQRARDRVRGEYELATIAARYQAFYEDVLARRV